MSTRALHDAFDRIEMSREAAVVSSSPDGAHSASLPALSSEPEQLAYARGLADGMEIMRQQYYPPVRQKDAA